ncbi:MAG: ATP-binding cassette domain-containing protein [Verrucomicrobia bacterium]|nr:ATP-binding cassette domain-containing protein [Verrucomicrobiota bacterium]
MPHPILKAKSVSKIYKHAAALSEVNLSIEKGDIYGIIGQSGAGKSTLIRCLASLLEPTSGQILFHDKDLLQMKGSELRAFRLKVGMIFQHFNLLSSRTAAGNIAYPMEIAGAADPKARIDELLGLVNLSSKKDVYPAQLSGGEKQRVGIARALANHPEILFCDEATSALDPKSTKEILDLLKAINKKLGITIVLITHDMEVIKKICNKVAVLDQGQVVEEGSVAQVFADPKHPITQYFIQSGSHEIPPDFFKAISPNRKLLRLRFKGDTANEPIISQIAKQFHVEANILMGWIDSLQALSIGTLIIELTGAPEGIEKALGHLREKSVHYEVLENG